jgi:hypothetical protein
MECSFTYVSVTETVVTLSYDANSMYMCLLTTYDVLYTEQVWQCCCVVLLLAAWLYFLGSLTLHVSFLNMNL